MVILNAVCIHDRRPRGEGIDCGAPSMSLALKMASGFDFFVFLVTEWMSIIIGSFHSSYGSFAGALPERWTFEGIFLSSDFGSLLPNAVTYLFKRLLFLDQPIHYEEECSNWMIDTLDYYQNIMLEVLVILMLSCILNLSEGRLNDSRLIHNTCQQWNHTPAYKELVIDMTACWFLKSVLKWCP